MNGEPTASPRPVLIFDGDCGFCTTTAQASRRWLRLDHVEPWQHLDLAALGVTEAECEEAVQWVAADGTVSSAQDAAIAALRHAGAPWSAIGRLLALPGVHGLAGVTYRWVARHRSQLPGGTPACQLPGPPVDPDDGD